jgi:hypothetical protein
VLSQEHSTAHDNLDGRLSLSILIFFLDVSVVWVPSSRSEDGTPFSLDNSLFVRYSCCDSSSGLQGFRPAAQRVSTLPRSHRRLLKELAPPLSADQITFRKIPLMVETRHRMVGHVLRFGDKDALAKEDGSLRNWQEQEEDYIEKVIPGAGWDIPDDPQGSRWDIARDSGEIPSDLGWDPSLKSFYRRDHAQKPPEFPNRNKTTARGKPTQRRARHYARSAGTGRSCYCFPLSIPNVVWAHRQKATTKAYLFREGWVTRHSQFENGT